MRCSKKSNKEFKSKLTSYQEYGVLDIFYLIVIIYL
jgi:hypothetical protein